MEVSGAEAAADLERIDGECHWVMRTDFLFRGTRLLDIYVVVHDRPRDVRPGHLCCLPRSM